MKTKCKKCGLVYDDEFFSTYCASNVEKRHTYIWPTEARQEMLRKIAEQMKDNP